MLLMYKTQHLVWTGDLCQGGLPLRGSYCLDAYQGLLSIISFPFKLSSSYCRNVWVQTSLTAAGDRNVKQAVRNRNQSYIQSCSDESIALKWPTVASSLSFCNFTLLLSSILAAVSSRLEEVTTKHGSKHSIKPNFMPNVQLFQLC